MYRLDKTNNAVFSLNYHFITVVKYRQEVFTGEEMIDDLKSMVKKISDDFDVTILGQECGNDHYHLLFRAKPTLDITKYINVIKGQTARELRKKHKDFLTDKLWGDSFWSPSYFLATTGNVTLDTLKNYVDSQREMQK